jgi:hypothetical protein
MYKMHTDLLKKSYVEDPNGSGRKCYEFLEEMAFNYGDFII